MPFANDWSAFTPEHIDELLRTQPLEAPGYLVWAKIDYECLMHDNLGAFLDSENIAPFWTQSHYIREIWRARLRIQGAVAALQERGITRICTGISWCDWVSAPSAKTWIRWYVRQFADVFDVVPRITFTPPRYTDGGTINAPPLRPESYAEFIDELLTELGDCFGDHIELWNEWNLDTDWRRDLDPDFAIFMQMVSKAAAVAHAHGKKVLLGGMAGITPDSIKDLAHLVRNGLTSYVDAVGFHDLRGTWGDQEPSAAIPDQVRYVEGTLRTPRSKHAVLPAGPRDSIPAVWLTEYGFPVIDPEHRFPLSYLENIQVALFAYATYCLTAKRIERIYWYTYQDYVGESVRAHTTGWEDVLQYYYGDTSELGTSRMLANLLDEGGAEFVLRYAAKHNLFPLVDAASLARNKPSGYRSNKAA